jgi:hypothetical protein
VARLARDVGGRVQVAPKEQRELRVLADTKKHVFLDGLELRHVGHEHRERDLGFWVHERCEQLKDIGARALQAPRLVVLEHDNEQQRAVVFVGGVAQYGAVLEAPVETALRLPALRKEVGRLDDGVLDVCDA